MKNRNAKPGSLSALRRFFYVQIWRRLKLASLILRAYIFNILVGLDLLANAIIGGDPGETISSRAGKGKLKGQPVHTFLAGVIDILFEMLFSQENHCVNAIQHDEGQGAISRVIDRYRQGKKQLWSL